jgi:hypothetical protein
MTKNLARVHGAASDRALSFVLGMIVFLQVGEGLRAAPPLRPNVLIEVVTEANTCLVGDPCNGICVQITRPDGSLVAQFEANTAFRGLRPSDPTVSEYPNRLCMHLDLTPEEQRGIRRSLAGFDEQVRAASGREMNLHVVARKVSEIELTYSEVFGGLWISSWDAAPFVASDTSPLTDGILVVSGSLDHDQNIRLPLAACGLSFGADFGVGGAGYSWVPFSNGYSFQCGTSQTLFHEWLHQVDWAYENLMLVPDTYQGGYPACGRGDSDPHHWFPSADTCTSDPDWTDCGQVFCQNLDLWNAHILSTHYDFALPYLGNHCRDGRQDYGETGVDVGGACGGEGLSGTRELGGPEPVPVR